ncbi:MAG: hypothetical protein H0V86_06375 [Chloroflexia bacterium]|nr:hypothetical protein [Chloroflexia bacterium]
MIDRLLFGTPSISYPGFKDALRLHASPAAVQDGARALYLTCVTEAMDPAVALAFARKEHSLRWLGAAEKTLGWGNVVCNERWRSMGGACIGRFAAYNSYEQGLFEWIGVMRRVYWSRGLRTISQATPVYAPASDNNDPILYAQQANRWIHDWEERYDTRMLEVIPAAFVVKITGDSVNIREFPGTAYEVIATPTKAASPTLAATGYVLDGPAYRFNGGEPSRTWCRVRDAASGRTGWVVLVAGLTEANLPQTAAELQERLRTCQNTNKKLRTSLGEATQTHDALVRKLQETKVQQPGTIITAAEAVGL